MFQALHVLFCRRFTLLIMFYRFCFIHFLFCSSTIRPMLYILRVQGVFYGPCCTNPLFTSSRFAQCTFESPGFTFPHFGIVHVLDKVYVLQRPRFLSSFFIRLCYKSMFYESALHDFISRQSKSPTLHVLRAYVLHSILSSHHVLRHSPCFSTLRHSPCFWT